MYLYYYYFHFYFKYSEKLQHFEFKSRLCIDSIIIYLKRMTQVEQTTELDKVSSNFFVCFVVLLLKTQA